MKSKPEKERCGASTLAPDFTLATVQGSYLSLNDLVKDKCAILLVFLRHLG
jgi:hypothetical protein